MSEKLDEVTLETLGGGAAAELWAEEFRKVVDNVWDPNAPARAARKIKLEVTITPSENRATAGVAIRCTSKLAPTSGVETQFFFGRRGGQTVALENNPRQAELFEDEAGDAQPGPLRAVVEGDKNGR